MRNFAQKSDGSEKYKIIAIDDDSGIIDTLAIIIKRFGYSLTGFSDPLAAIEKIKEEHFDLLLLDFLMTPIHGDMVVEKIREFNNELYILLLTGHKDLAPPLETIKKLSIQGYWEKTDKFDQLLLLIESAIKSIDQVRAIKQAHTKLEESKTQLEEAYLASIDALKFAVEAKSSYTRGHSDRVSEMSVLFGKSLNLSDEELRILKYGGLFHDVGKLGIPDTILLKGNKLTTEEYDEIKKHPTIGKQILNVSIFEDLIPIVLNHHENYDGTGYPEKLKGADIPFLARMVSVIDTFDAMSSDRPYRDALPLDYIKAEFAKLSGIQFDPDLATKFLDILEKHYDEILDIQNKY